MESSAVPLASLKEQITDLMTQSGESTTNDGEWGHTPRQHASVRVALPAAKSATAAKLKRGDAPLSVHGEAHKSTPSAKRTA